MRTCSTARSPRRSRPAHAAEFDRWIEADGGLDVQLLGIGRNGHIGFNEPSELTVAEALRLPTRLVELHPVTRADAAREFGGIDRVIPRALTMGIASILAARSIVILATGEHKAEAVARALDRPDDRRAARLALAIGRRPSHLGDRRAGGKGLLDSLRISSLMAPIDESPGRDWHPAALASRPRPRPADDLAGVAAVLVGGDGVDGVDISLGRRFDDVGRGGAAAERAVVALDFEIERHLALRVLALGHAPDDELVQVGANARDPLDGLEDRVDRAVADGGVLDDLAVGTANADRGRRQDARARPSCAG